MDICGYQVELVSDNIYRISENPAINSYLLIGSSMAMMIDTGGGFGNLRNVIESLVNVPYLVVNTHGHFDHVAANYQFESVYISEEDSKLMCDFYDSPSEKASYFKLLEVLNIQISNEMRINLENAKAPQDIRILEDNQEFDLGDRKVTCIKVPGHTKGCVAFLDSKSRILFNGDVILRHAELGLVGSTNLEIWKKGLEKLWSMRDRFDLTVAAHGHKSPSFRPLEPEYIKRLISCAEKLNIEKSVVKNSFYGLAYEYFENEEKHDKENDVSITFRLETLNGFDIK